MNKAWMDEPTQAEVDRWRKFGDVTSQGVVYHWELAGPQGARFVLIREGQSISTLKKAAKELRWQRDVVGAITYVDVRIECP